MHSVTWAVSYMAYHILRCSPLADLEGGARSFAGITEGCSGGGARYCRAAAGGPVALGRAGTPRGILQ